MGQPALWPHTSRLPEYRSSRPAWRPHRHAAPTGSGSNTETSGPSSRPGSGSGADRAYAHPQARRD
ncbi:hypothetical protein AD936_08980 [Gluconobacter japonicus]|nr:hypothetical protein AD936_08980 [Gluconobacter japonicus]